jgi:hypothetical protein
MGRSRTPKRRGRPIGSRNASVNQFIRTRSLIWKLRKDQYESYFDPKLIDIARRVNDECNTAGTDCDDDLILSFHDEWSVGGRQHPIPYLNPSLFRPKIYYEIKDVSDFAIESANVYFYSPMLIANPSGFRSINYANYIDFQGRRRLSLERGYRRYFKEWVDWVNTYYREQGIDDSEDIEVYFTLIPPYWDEEKGFWIVEIVSCTSDGRVGDFGFKPDGSGDQSTDDFNIPEEQPLEPQGFPIEIEEPAPTPVSTPQEPTLEERTRATALRKEKKLERLLKVKEDAKNDYKFWKEMGDEEELKLAKARIKDITNQIDKLQK